MPSLGDIETTMYLAAQKVDVLYDNSKAFSTYLKKQGLESILSQTNLKLREKHMIVPPVRIWYSLQVFTPLTERTQREHVSLHASQNALPKFPDDESWYRHVSRTRRILP
jgi:hypothetical protein